MQAVKAIVLTSMLTFSCICAASNSNAFQIDMIIFQNIATPSDAEPSSEIWPDYAPMLLPNNAISLVARAAAEEDTNDLGEATQEEQATEEGATKPSLLKPYTALDENSFLLSRQLKRISKSDNFKIIWHKSWIQPAHTASGKTIAIRDTDMNDPIENTSLIGTVTIENKRFFTVSVNLDLADSTSDKQPKHYRLIESRNIHENKLNYFDHPKLGVLLIVK